MNIFNNANMTPEQIKSAGKTILYLAIFELVAAIIMLLAPLFGATLVVYFIGVAALIAGASKIIQTVKLDASIGSKILGLILGLMYIFVGIYAFTSPGKTLLSLTFVFGFILLVEGVVLISKSGETPSSGLSIFNGIITMLLGFMFLNNYPASVVWLPFYIGFSLLFNAIGLFVVYNAVKKQQ